jgi:hypothetical protein
VAHRGSTNEEAGNREEAVDGDITEGLITENPLVSEATDRKCVRENDKKRERQTKEVEAIGSLAQN